MQELTVGMYQLGIWEMLFILPFTIMQFLIPVVAMIFIILIFLKVKRIEELLERKE